jgi:PAS domain-containing protein
VVRANRSFYRVFGVGSAETDGQLVEELGNRQWSSARLRALLEDSLRNGAIFDGFEVVNEFPGIGRRRMVLSGRPVSIQGDETAALIVLGIQDASEASAAIRGSLEDPET